MENVVFMALDLNDFLVFKRGYIRLGIPLPVEKSEEEN